VKRSIAIWLASGLWLLTPLSHGGSIETPFTIVHVKDLPVGRRTRVQLASGERYSVVNKSALDVELTLKGVIPYDKRSRRNRWQPVPDPSWLSVTPAELTLAPGESGEADVTLAVPDDPKLSGKRYEVWLLAETTGGQFGVGLVTRIKFNTVPAPAETPHGTGTGSSSKGKP
jgi:hypothetical protein